MRSQDLRSPRPSSIDPRTSNRIHQLVLMIWDLWLKEYKGMHAIYLFSVDSSLSIKYRPDYPYIIDLK